MYFIKSNFTFDSAHFLYGYDGKCSNIHGHTWKVEVTVKNAFLQDKGEKKGMIMDFSDLKKTLSIIADNYDHALLYEKNTLKQDTMDCLNRDGFKLVELQFRPTAENLARHFFMQIKEHGCCPHNVTVYETPNNCAMYEEG